jgi:hypothetical protein
MEAKNSKSEKTYTNQKPNEQKGQESRSPTTIHPARTMDPILDAETMYPQLKDVEVKISRRVLFDVQGTYYNLKKLNYFFVVSHFYQKN